MVVFFDTDTYLESPMTHLERFLAVMEYKPVDRLPNWEAGVWPQTRQRWNGEGLDRQWLFWDWFKGEGAFGMDPREFIYFHGSLLPGFEQKTLAEDERTITFRDNLGRVRTALKDGTVEGGRSSMDTYVSFAVSSLADWQAIKPRFDPTNPRRYEQNWRTYRPAGWRDRQHPLIFGPNCSTMGFYWMARELLGTEGLSFAWYDQPELMHDMMGFWGDFLIEAGRPVLEQTSVDYICLAEDMSMKTGPLLSPATYRTFIWPHMKRVVEFYKGHGCRYVVIDTDGNPEALIPLLLDAGVDAIWPMERAAEQDPIRLRKTFGESLRLWGGVDKRELAKDRPAIEAHLRTLAPLVEQGGFIPTVDHTVPPDVSLDNFRHYMELKAKLLAGKL